MAADRPWKHLADHELMAILGGEPAKIPGNAAPPREIWVVSPPNCGDWPGP
jgi:hypothetical protein